MHLHCIGPLKTFLGSHRRCRRMGPFPLGEGLDKHFCPNISSLPESQICLGNAFCPKWGGREESNSFEDSNGVWDTKEMRVYTFYGDININ